MRARLTAAIAAAAMAIPIAAAGAAPALAAPARVLLTLQVTDRAGHRVAPADAQVMAVPGDSHGYSEQLTVIHAWAVR